MKTRTYIITGTISFIVGLLIIYAAFAFVTLESNPLNWHRYSRVVFVLFGWMFPLLATLVSITILKAFDDSEKEY